MEKLKYSYKHIRESVRILRNDGSEFSILRTISNTIATLPFGAKPGVAAAIDENGCFPP
jgi:hypothetical protein